MKERKFSIKERAKSFGYAWNGLRILFSEEHNARIHACVLLFVVFLGWLLSIATQEWITVTFCATLVLAAEAFNAALENICDAVTVDQNPFIKKSKDLAAAAVLLCAVASVIIGLIIFLPKIYTCLFEKI